MPYPTFIIIGSMKGGTTSLYHYIDAHPDISVSRIKETNYFLGKEEYRKGPQWYASLFNEGTQAVGEASPNYTKRHLWPGTAERMAKALPDAKLIYTVRDPIDRIVSHYVHNYAHGREGRSLSEAIAVEPNYLKTSMYAWQLEAFSDYYPMDRILILDSSDLRDDTQKTMTRVLRFIGVRTSHDILNTDRTFHAGADKLRRPFLERRIGNRRLRRVLHRLTPSRLSEPQPFARPHLSADDRKRLADALHSDIERFRETTGMRFDTWAV